MEDEHRAALLLAAQHSDPWFAAMGRAQLDLDPHHDSGDADLVARLEAQTVERPYVAPVIAAEDLDVPGPHGPVGVRVYHPAAEGTARSWLVWCHGGAFVGGDLDMPEADATARELAARAGAVVVSVDYRLAVEGVHFPVPHDDVRAAYEWALSHASQLGLLGRGVIGGGSAGANLAAGVALRLRDEGRAPDGVILLYGVLHPVLPAPSDELASKLSRLSSPHRFDADITRAVVENYLGGPAEEASTYAMPALGDLRGFPPTLLINCEYDGLRASGEAFAEALRIAGVPTTELLAPDVLHGHINSPWLPQAQVSYADMAAWLLACTSPLRS
jgi:acetyl esterase/lipase